MPINIFVFYIACISVSLSLLYLYRPHYLSHETEWNMGTYFTRTQRYK